MPVRQTQAYCLTHKDTTVKAKQLREMSRDDLSGALVDLEKRLFELRSQAVTEKLENTKAVINARRDIARIKTLLRQQEGK
jgi:large subunit ribosomal protein L29